MLKFFLKGFAVLLFCILLLAHNVKADILFDSTDDSIDCGTMSDAVLTENGAVTISAWVHPTGQGGNNNGLVVGRGTGTTTGCRFEIAATYQIRFIVTGSTVLYRSSVNNTLIVNTWCHLLLTWDGSTTGTNIHIYKNGTEVSYSASQNGVSLTDNSTSTLIIGNVSTLGRCWAGNITEVAVWNVVLSASEIALLASPKIKGIPLQIQPSALKGYWSMDNQETGTSADGDTIRDLSGNNNNGTGADGANNTGLSWVGESILSYSPKLSGFK